LLSPPHTGHPWRGQTPEPLLRAEQAASSNGTSLRLITVFLLSGGPGGCSALCKCWNFLHCQALTSSAVCKTFSVVMRSIRSQSSADRTDWAPSQQHEQRSGVLSQQVMEASHLFPQDTSGTWCQIHRATQIEARLAAQAWGYWVIAFTVTLPFPSVPALASYLLDPHFTDPSPLLSTGFPGSPLPSLPVLI
jgi:hypothetical protein